MYLHLPLSSVPFSPLSLCHSHHALALPPPLSVAIIGGGPGGPGTTIALSSLPNVTVPLFEQERELRESGLASGFIAGRHWSC